MLLKITQHVRYSILKLLLVIKCFYFKIECKNHLKQILYKPNEFQSKGHKFQSAIIVLISWKQAAKSAIKLENQLENSIQLRINQKVQYNQHEHIVPILIIRKNHPD